MKILSILGISCCFLVFKCFANTNLEEEVTKKTYVSSESIYIAPNAIYANINGQFILVQTVSIDSLGIYIEPFENYTICGRCGGELKRGHRCPDKK